MTDNGTQLKLTLPREPQQVDFQNIERLPNMTRAIVLCADLAGLKSDKDQARAIGIDATTWSLIKKGERAYPHDQYETMFDEFRNEVPLLYLLHRRGYDPNSLRRRESETEKLLREEKEKNAQLERDNKVLIAAIRGEKA